jgi:hypothetical protein
MKIEIKFTVIHRERRPNEFSIEAFVSDDRIYRAIQDIGHDRLNAMLPRDSDITIYAFEGDPSLEQIFQLLGEAGWKPHFGETLPRELMPTHFWVRRFRRYEKGYRDNCTYLSVRSWSDGDPIFDFDSVRDGLYCGKVAGAKWKTRYGQTYDCGASPYFINGELKRELEAENLIGIDFKPVLFDKPEKVRGEFWQVTSNIIMPPCLLPVITIPDNPPLVVYDDGGHYPQELVFEAAAVKEIEPFDVAITREDVVCRPNSWCRKLVVSQRFRKVAREHRMTTVDLVPVRLR